MRKIQRFIIETLGVLPQIDAKVELRKTVDFLKAYMKKNNLKTLVLGISGGQDSTLTGKCCQIAINELKEEYGVKGYKFIAVRLPYGVQKDEQDARDALNFIQPDEVVTINIKQTVDAGVNEYERQTGKRLSDFVKGNRKARERMVAQFEIAAENQGIVVGTDHAAEAVTGFFTKYGDGAADIAPIFRLNKRQGRMILKELGCPEHLYLKVPTADLEDDKPQLADEVALGVTYENIDDFLEGKEIPEQAAETIEAWFIKTLHKRNQPVTVFDEWWKNELNQI